MSTSFYGRGGISNGSGGSKNTAQIFTKTKEEWAQTPSLMSKERAIYVYSNHRTQIKDDVVTNIPAIKIGDGVTYVVDLPFVGEIQNIEDYLVTLQEKEYWNSKVDAAVYQTDSENLILFR